MMKKPEVLKLALEFAERIKSPYTWEKAEEGEECKYCGTYQNIQPSKKYYVPWTTNKTASDLQMDLWFWDEVERLLPGYSFQAGESDGCDCYCYRNVTLDDRR